MSAAVAETEPRTFSEVSALLPLDSGRFEGEIDTEWTIGGKPNGGYLLSMLGGAATWAGDHRHVIAASAHYLRSPDPGPVTIEVETLRSGRSASQVRGRMDQNGRTCVDALITTSRLEPGTKPYWQDGLPRTEPVPLEQCLPLKPALPDDVRVAIMNQVEVRLEPESAGFTKGRPSGRGELRGWLTLPFGETFDTTALLFAVDAFPPASFDIEYSGWVPTLELTVYVRAIPAPGPVRVVQRAQMICGGRLDEVCYVWDSAGQLVAHGTQLAGIRLV
jgi:acyl-Coa thioesterase superfamily protein/acyl-CoA thioesterase superfamily protein